MASKEVEDAEGARPSLEARAAALRQIVRTKSEKELAAEELATVERQIAAEAAADLKDAAAKRLLGIQRAMGSLAATLEQDDAKLLAAAAAYTRAMETLTDRFDKLALLRHEAAALVEGFGLEKPALPLVMVPGMRPAVREAVQLVTHAPVRETGFIPEQIDFDTKRRTYTELAGTDGGALLRTRTQPA